jgi:hypothetical protein
MGEAIEKVIKKGEFDIIGATIWDSDELVYYQSVLRKTPNTKESSNSIDNKQSAFASQMPCSPCTASNGSMDCDGIFGSNSCAERITRHFAHL